VYECMTVCIQLPMSAVVSECMSACIELPMAVIAAGLVRHLALLLLPEGVRWEARVRDGLASAEVLVLVSTVSTAQ
jgi:hypothetical protein